MSDLLLQYRACGAECRDDYLRQVAHGNGLPLTCVRRIADRLGEREDFGALILICETRQLRGAAKCQTWWSVGSSETSSDIRRENFSLPKSLPTPKMQKGRSPERAATCCFY